MAQGGASLALVILAAGRAKRYGGCKPLAPVGTHGEAVIDLVASDALDAGFSTIVLVLGPSTGPAIRYHIEHTWPSGVDVRFATQPAPLGTVNAVLSASDHVGDAPYGVGNADDIYGRDACALLAAAPARRGGYQRAGGLPARRCRHRLLPRHRVASAGWTRRATCSGVDERRQVTATPEGGFVAGDGRQPETLSGDDRVSMNLWGFTPAFHKTLQAAMEAAVDASEEAEVLLPEVVAQSLGTSPFVVLPATGRCVGVTHPGDLSLVQDELNREVAAGERPARLWSSLH